MPPPDIEFRGNCIFCNTPMYFDNDTGRFLLRNDSDCNHRAEGDEEEDDENIKRRATGEAGDAGKR